jgi:predicted nucleic-acid-binding Zn-ribbon protein
MNEQIKKDVVIKCPRCGMEYLPAEIFMPDDFLGKPESILRDDNGHIEFHEGNSLGLDETYTCDKCGCVFDVHGDVSFTTSEHAEDKSKDDYVTVIHKDRINLKED